MFFFATLKSNKLRVSNASAYTCIYEYVLSILQKAHRNFAKMLHNKRKKIIREALGPDIGKEFFSTSR